MHKDLDSFTENLVKSIVLEPDMVKVQEFNSDDDVIQLEILVTESDMPRIIGKSGKMAKAIRVLIQAMAYNKGINKIRINIDSF